MPILLAVIKIPHALRATSTSQRFLCLLHDWASWRPLREWYWFEARHRKRAIGSGLEFIIVKFALLVGGLSMDRRRIDDQDRAHGCTADANHKRTRWC